MGQKRASKMLSEKQLRALWEKRSGKVAMIDTDRLGRGGRPSSAYAEWLETTVRTWWPELSAMMEREDKRIIAQHNMKKSQTTLFNTGE